ncbi:ribosome small subunit-dependent GTPase A [Enterovibrio norvegicus FF-33]|uniref:Small ribosomal subunit biogenesis GTPase RsgA n=1 Tax=Enterovibrio norvegicus FF-454 TaxID=1185651 RepID=A0A1E5C4E2_9GAMM|nr:ribosome small subunit-dependent GTPase A [Enterovibrio norvegicus]OEE60062.1 ribosome small subunit-dependent GTPase A [Enterovibrio norvegicus FF-454]OEE66389.1 ribosome small subunit-dependent GTPase A [Enterovibrio norvegicus FF-33]OEE89794.1 ribosome small subunit-dependent GTPase A [Enterovibrio norvegicus FF-162]
MTPFKTLSQLGWQPVFQQQLTLEDYENTRIARIAEHHRSHYLLINETGTESLEIHASFPSMTVGDWILIDDDGHFIRQLDRQSLFARKGAGTKVIEQLIAANIDTAFVVCALDHDFNLNRIERYLAMCADAFVEPVVVLTKRDLAENSLDADGNAFDLDETIRSVEALAPFLAVEAVNALDEHTANALSPWLKAGKTLVVMGSSGVGKSTLVNTLLGDSVQTTGGIRESDSKGRHTTTARSLHCLPSGAVLLDTPGMRELKIFDSEDGLNTLFAEIKELESQCRFSDCQHGNEPGCAIRAALETGNIDERRLSNYLKLQNEDARNSATMAQKRAKDKTFTKMVNTIQSSNRHKKKGF